MKFIIFYVEISIWHLASVMMTCRLSPARSCDDDLCRDKSQWRGGKENRGGGIEIELCIMVYL